MIRAARRTFFSVIVLGSLAGATGFAPALAQGIDTSTLPRGRLLHRGGNGV